MADAVALAAGMARPGMPSCSPGLRIVRWYPSYGAGATTSCAVSGARRHGDGRRGGDR